MHLKFAGLADDVDDKESYGWANCVRLKDIDNAGKRPLAEQTREEVSLVQ